MKKSFLSKIIVYKTPIVSNYTKDISDTVNNVYDLVEDLENEEISINKANLEIIDTMIKYDVVSKKTVEQLVVFVAAFFPLFSPQFGTREFLVRPPFFLRKSMI